MKELKVHNQVSNEQTLGSIYAKHQKVKTTTTEQTYNPIKRINIKKSIKTPSIYFFPDWWRTTMGLPQTLLRMIFDGFFYALDPW